MDKIIIPYRTRRVASNFQTIECPFCDQKQGRSVKEFEFPKSCKVGDHCFSYFRKIKCPTCQRWFTVHVGWHELTVMENLSEKKIAELSLSLLIEKRHDNHKFSNYKQTWHTIAKHRKYGVLRILDWEKINKINRKVK